MSVTIPQFGQLPNADTMTESQFNAAWNNYFSNVDAYGSALTALALEVEGSSANVAAAVESLANAVWVSGTSYTAGQVRYSPVDFLSYRRKTNGAGTTDPSQDPANWELQTSTSVGGAETNSSATDITLTFTSARLQVIGMTAADKRVVLPSATTLKKGAPLFVFKNTGAYRYSVHKNGGGFLCYVNPGQVLAAHCSDNGTAPGVWHISGQDVDQIYGGNNAEVLNAVDSRSIAVAMLSSTQAICAFRNNSTTFLTAVVLNFGSASGAPAQVAAQNANYISIAAQTPTQATIVYKTSTGTVRAVVLDITGNTFTPGVDKQIDAGAGGIGTSVTALSATQLLAVYQSTTSGTSPKMRVLDIVSSAINESAQVEADATATASDQMVIARIASNKALLVFRRSVSNQERLQLRLQSITGSTPAPTGTVLDHASMTGTINASQFGAVVLSASRAVTIEQPDLSQWSMLISVYDISGITPVLLRDKFVNVNASNALNMTATKLDGNNIHAMWIGGGNLGIGAARITVTGDDDIIFSSFSGKTESNVTNAKNYIACAALDGAHVMQVCRNKDTYLSAKTLEIAT